MNSLPKTIGKYAPKKFEKQGNHPGIQRVIFRGFWGQMQLTCSVRALKNILEPFSLSHTGTMPPISGFLSSERVALAAYADLLDFKNVRRLRVLYNRYSGWAGWVIFSPTRRQDNDSPAFLTPCKVYQLTLPYSRTLPPDPLYRICHLLNNNKKGKCHNLVSEEMATLPIITPFNNSNPSNNTNSFNNTIVINLSSAHERGEILAWLSPLEPRIRHRDIRAGRVEGVGDWLLQKEEYQNWFDGIRDGEPDNSALFCCGDPGVGKTYIR